MKRRVALAAMVWLLCGAVAVLAQQRREIRFPDVPGYQTLKCDLHEHTVFSDGLVWPTVRVDEAWREGLDAIAITDHIEYQPHKDDLPTNHNRPYELAAGKARERGIILIKGAEVTRATPPGHFNAIFLEDINPLDTKEFYDVFDEAVKQNAFVFWNHPGWQGEEKGRWGEEQTRLLEKKQLHGIEVCNDREYYADAHREALARNLTMLGNADIHEPAPTEPPTPEEHRTLTLVFASERSSQGIREALDARRTAVWYQNEVIGREEQLAPLFEACVEVLPPHHQDKDRVWVKVRNHCELDITLERAGEHGPGTIKLPAEATTLVRIDAPADVRAAGLSCRATNFLIGPEKPLLVKLVIPAQ
ncbi:MAG: histidinol-phosphatase [Phycisphaerae bacterium]|nr:histidinol-phosphatase [Phycisphaerae bacterium]